MKYLPEYIFLTRENSIFVTIIILQNELVIAAIKQISEDN